MTFVLIAFAVMLLGGAPIALAMSVPAAIYLVQSDLPFSVLAQRLPQSLNSFPLLAIPLFIVAGRLLNEGGITERIFRFSDGLVGWISGGLGHVNVVGSMIFSGMSGTALADLGGIGQIEVKAMKDAGYPMRFIAGITATSAIVGPVIPPSVPFILFAVASDTSILALFAAGMIPGFVIGIFLMIAVYIYARFLELPKSQWQGSRTLWRNFVAAIPPLMAPVLLIGGMMSGMFSPTEAAGITVFYALFLAVVIYGDLKWSQLPGLLLEMLPMIANLGYIIASSLLFAWVLVIEQVPQLVVDFLTQLSTDKWVLLTIVVAAFLVLGCFIEATVVFLVVAPMLMPTLKAVGVSDIHFGVVTVVAMGMGLFMPPVGLALYMLRDMCKISFDEAVKAVLPFQLALLASLIVITYFPEITLIGPRWLGLID
jgi:tripartite ATP-independent transporter DctM subunit